MYRSDSLRRMFSIVVVLAIALAAAWAILTAVQQASAQAQEPWQYPVTGLTVTQGDEPGELNISWDSHPEGPNNYRISLAEEDGDFRTYTNLDWNAFVAANSHAVTGLTPDGQYKARVKARLETIRGRTGAT